VLVLFNGLRDRLVDRHGISFQPFRPSLNLLDATGRGACNLLALRPAPMSLPLGRRRQAARLAAQQRLRCAATKHEFTATFHYRSHGRYLALE